MRLVKHLGVSAEWVREDESNIGIAIAPCKLSRLGQPLCRPRESDFGMSQNSRVTAP